MPRNSANRGASCCAGASKKASSLLYRHRVVLAHREWQDSNIGRASQLLNECRPDLREWEWSYLRRLCDSDLFTLSGHTAPVVSAAFSPDGRFLASSAGLWFSSEPAEVKFWDATAGQLLWTGRGHTGPVMAVAISPDGKQVASASVVWGKNNGEIKIWEAATGKTLRTLSGTSGVFGLAYSPNGKWLASAGGDAKVRLWDAVTGKQSAIHEEHKSSVFSVAFSPDSRLLASASLGRNGRGSGTQPPPSRCMSFPASATRAAFPSVPTASAWLRRDITKLSNCGMSKAADSSAPIPGTSPP